MQARAPRNETISVGFTLNGRAVSAVAAPFASLADTLRHELGLTGTKIGCEAGDCGACTVLLDGAQVCACLVTTEQARDATVDTVEGAGPGGLTDRLRVAFLEHGAAQCGICTPGMLMAATDLLARTPAPSQRDVEDAIGGVLCRCTGYVKIVEAILATAGETGRAAGTGTGEGSAQPVLRQAQDEVAGCGTVNLQPRGEPVEPQPCCGAAPQPDQNEVEYCGTGERNSWSVLRQAQDEVAGCGTVNLQPRGEPVEPRLACTTSPRQAPDRRLHDWPSVHSLEERGEDATAAAGGSVGARLPRVDGWPKVDGSDRFGADEAPANALWMRVVRSPHARARFTLGDLASVTTRMPGLAAILTHKDVPGENTFGVFPNTKDQPVLAPGHVRFRGEAVLALVGTREAVEGIADADLPITWEPGTPASGIDAALAPGAPAIHVHVPDNILTRGNLQRGDVEAGRAAAAVTAEGRFETQFVEHAYIEPEAGYAVPLGDGPDRIEVSACTQAPYMDLEETARVLGVDPSRVRIRPTACGGGFGGKLDVSVQPLLAVAAWVTRRPVRIIYTRTESMASTTKRHPARIFARSSADARGRLTAFEMQADFNTGAYASWGPTVANRVPVHGMGPYKVPNAAIRTRAIYTNDTPAGAFRGFGIPQAAIAHETLMDDLAERLGMDRWAIRRINALDHGDATCSGQVLAQSAGLPQCLDALKADWEAALARVAAHNASAPRHRRGIGIGCMWYGCGNTALPNPSTMRIALGRDGRLTFFNGAVDIGQGSSTVLLQIAADALGLPPRVFRMIVGDTDLTEDAGKTSASRQTFVSGNAARLAAEDLRRKILALANAGPDATLTLEGTRLTIADGEASRTIDLGTLPVLPSPRASRASTSNPVLSPSKHGLEDSPAVPVIPEFREAKYPGPSAPEPATSGSRLSALRAPAGMTDGGVVLEGIGTWDPPTTPLDADGQGVPYATYGFAAQMAEVEVDTALGTTKVVAIVAAHDVGRAINPTLVEGQIHGGIAQGLGMALMEEFIPGRTENLHDYLIPTAGDIPPIKTYLIEDTDPNGPFGAKGVGEPALIATAPAILSAIRHATGVRLARTPALPHRLWEELRGTGA